MRITVDTGAVRVLDRRGQISDAFVALILLLSTVITIPLSAGAIGTEVQEPLTAIWAILLVAPLALRRSFPATVAVLVVAVFIAGQALSLTEYIVSQIAPFLAIYSLGAWSPRRRRVALVVASLSVVLTLWFLLDVALSRSDPEATPASVALAALSTALYVGAAIAFGEAGWRSALRRDALERRTKELQEERELTARQAVDLERTRIARDLHDVLAHHVSLMGIEAGAARRVLVRTTSDTVPAQAALARIEESSRRAVEELGRTVSTLRRSATDLAEATSAPSTIGFQQIGELIDDARKSGLAVQYERSGDADGVGPTVVLALHRIVQESLTNVRKHAGLGGVVSVTLRLSPELITLTVHNTGGAGSAATSAGTGTGQIGMRERALAAGGSITMEPVDDGYRVQLTLPVPR
jgi:signal transduction histidine kinase